MKEVTLVQEYRVTSIIKNAENNFADFLVNYAETNASEFADAAKKDLGADNVEIIKTQVFEFDRSESAEEKKQREIRELTERLLKLVSE